MSSEQAGAPARSPTDPGRPVTGAARVGRVLLVLAVLAAVIVVGRWLTAGPPLPSRAEAEGHIAGTIGLQEHTTVTASCDEPDEDGVTCRLRDAAGRYGSSVSTFHREAGETEYELTRLMQLTIWDFPINSDGILVKELDTTPPWDIGTRIFATVILATAALGPPDPGTRADCPQVAVVGDTVPCTVRGQLRTGTLHRLALNRYRLTLTFRLPTGDRSRPTQPPG